MDKKTERNIIIGVVGAGVIIGTGIFFYNQYKKKNPPPNTTTNNSNANNSSSGNTNTNTTSGAGNCNGSNCVNYWRMFVDPSYALGVMKNIK